MLITDLDYVIEKVVKEKESIYSCIIFLDCDNDNWTMTVAYPCGLRCEEFNLGFCNSKFDLATKIRRAFRK